jgi:hypothetical protein
MTADRRAETLPCRIHPDRPAIGVCMICRQPFCEECGGPDDTVSLCHQHSALEIYDRGAVVFRSDDLLLVEIAGAALRKERLHPFVVSRAIAPVTNLGRLTPDPTLGPHLIIVPFGEYLQARRFLEQNDFLRS